jgi:DNA-binding transcriptional ArsR family regulator
MLMIMGLLMSEEEPGTSTNPEIEMKLSHELYLRAVNNPLRRKILDALTEGNATVEELEAKTNLDEITLRWHLNVLESGLCVENKQDKVIYKLTQFGKVVKYLK